MKNIDNPCIWLIILWFQGCPLPSSALYTCRSLVTTRRRPGSARNEVKGNRTGGGLRREVRVTRDEWKGQSMSVFFPALKVLFHSCFPLHLPCLPLSTLLSASGLGLPAPLSPPSHRLRLRDECNEMRPKAWGKEEGWPCTGESFSEFNRQSRKVQHSPFFPALGTKPPGEEGHGRLKEASVRSRERPVTHGARSLTLLTSRRRPGFTGEAGP